HQSPRIKASFSLERKLQKLALELPTVLPIFLYFTIKIFGFHRYEPVFQSVLLQKGSNTFLSKSINHAAPAQPPCGGPNFHRDFVWVSSPGKVLRLLSN